MMTTKKPLVYVLSILAVVLSLTAGLTLTDVSGQVRAGRRGVAVRGEEGKGAAVGRRGAVVKGDEGYAAVGRRGAIAVDEEGKGSAVGRRGTIVKGEEGVAAVGRYGGVVVGQSYEDHEGWKTAARVGAAAVTAIAVGTMLSRPPAQATTVVVSGTTYWRYQNTYYMRVYSGGNVAYQVVAPPR